MVGQLMNLLTNPYYRISVVFYTVLIIIVSVLGWLSQEGLENIYRFCVKRNKRDVFIRRDSEKLRYMKGICFFLAFFLLWFFSAFASCGADRGTYGIIFSDATWQSVFDGWQEPGFVIFNLIFRIFGKEPRIIYIAISTVTLVLFFNTLAYLKKEISVGFAILAYGCLYYVQSLSLMRIYMAAAILFWGVRYLKREIYWKYGIVIIITGLIHYSSFMLLLPFGLLYLTYAKKYKKNVHFYGIVLALGIAIGGVLAGAPMLSNFVVFSRFQRYLEGITSAQIGIMQFMYFLPICLLIWLVFHKCNENYQRIFLVFTAFAFLIGILSYVVPVLGRAFSLFPIIYFWIVPYALKVIKSQCKKKWIKFSLNIFAMGYYMFRFFLYVVEYAKLDAIIPYTNYLL